MNLQPCPSCSHRLAPSQAQAPCHQRRKTAKRAQAVTAEMALAAAVQRPPHGRVYNFAAGPACLPVSVLEQAQADLLNWQGTGTSVMEMSHRGKAFSKILAQAESDLRELLSIPQNYKASPKLWYTARQAADKLPCG